MKMLNLLSIILILLSSCYSKKASISHNTKASISYNGIWKSIGHGQILEIKDNLEYAFYDITSISCLPRRKGSLDEISNSLNLNKDTLSLLQAITNYEFTRLTHLPNHCKTALNSDKANDPLYNFEVFMETVKEHYAFLDLNNINWNELYNKQKAKLTKNSTPAELFLNIEETYEMLNDNHAFLDATDDVYEALDASSEDDIASDKNLTEYGDFPVAAMVAEEFLKEDMTKDSWLIHWGKVTDDVGYIQLKAMWLFADLNLSQEKIDEIGFVDAFGEARKKMYEGHYTEKEVEGVRKVMDRVMNDLTETKSIIIDVRFNGGGQDVVSFEILSRFISDKTQVASYKYRYGNLHTDAAPVYIEGSKMPYKNPVYLLTSPQTGSAAESFALATMSLLHIKRIGSSTEGALSTTLDKILPIGWDFYISSEVYMDTNGKCYENYGIPVDYELNYSRDRQTFFRSVADDLEKDKQSILNAIEKLRSN